MEKYINIPTSDGFEIKGVLNWKEKSDRLIVIVHGLTGSMTEAHYYAGKEYFTQKGYDVFRFNLYTDGENTRKLKDCSIKNHSQDIDNVMSFFQNYKEVSIISHSLGGPSVLGISNYPKNVERIIFWDPAFEMKTRAEKCYFKNESIYTTISGKEIEISQEMYAEFIADAFLETLKNHNFDRNKTYAVYADNGGHLIHKRGTDIMGIESHVIEGANHGFTQEGKYEELFEQTLEFIEK